MPSRLNQLVVRELTEKFRGVDTCVFVDFSGLTGRKAADLRKRLNAECGERAVFTVVKAALAKQALRENEEVAALAEDLPDDLLAGPTGIAYGGDDPVQVARVLADWSKKPDNSGMLRLKGGLLAGRPLTADAVAKLAKIPPKPVLMAQVIGMIAAPLTSLLSVAQGPIRKLLGLADALAKKKESEAN